MSSFPYETRQAVKPLGGAVGFIILFAALIASFWLIRSESSEIRSVVRQGMGWVSNLGRLAKGHKASPDASALSPRPADGFSEASRMRSSHLPVYGRDGRSFVPDMNGFGNLGKRIGESITLRAMSFENDALQRCVKRCELPFRDHFGRTVVGVFHKDAHYNKLRASRGKVSITGLVQRAPDQTYVIYIQRIL